MDSDKFRFMNGKQTLEFLKAQKYTREQTMKAQANEKAWKRRPDVLMAFGKYFEWLDKGDGEQLTLTPSPSPLQGEGRAPVEKSMAKKESKR